MLVWRREGRCHLGSWVRASCAVRYRFPLVVKGTRRSVDEYADRLVRLRARAEIHGGVVYPDVTSVCRIDRDVTNLERLAEIRQQLGTAFSLEELQAICFDLGLDYDDLGGETKTGKIIWDFDTAVEFPTVNGIPARGGSMAATGATVADGMLYVNSGYSGMRGNVLLAFGTK